MWTYAIEDNGFNRSCDVVVMHRLEKVTIVTVPEFERAVEFVLSHQEYVRDGIPTYD